MKKVIQIYGTERSGSTLLDLILGNTKEGMSLGEIYAWFRPYMDHHRSFRCSCSNPNCGYLDTAKRANQVDLYSYLLKAYKKKYLVDSSKDPYWYQSLMSSSIRTRIEVLNVVVWKTPKSYAFSKFKRGEINGCLRHYAKYYGYALTLLDDFVSVQFDEFLRDPKGMLTALCTHLGINFDESMLGVPREYHIFFGSGTLRKSLKDRGLVWKETVSYPLEFEHKYASLGAARVDDLISRLHTNDVMQKRGVIPQNTRSVNRAYGYFMAKSVTRQFLFNTGIFKRKENF